VDVKLKTVMSSIIGRKTRQRGPFVQTVTPKHRPPTMTFAGPPPHKIIRMQPTDNQHTSSILLQIPSG
jgi:hypothetical protein